MSEIIEITDDFDLDRIADCGQCFRARRLDDGDWIFVTLNHILRIRQEDTTHYSVSCTRNEWDHIWGMYFDMERDYSSIREDLSAKAGNLSTEAYEFLTQSCECGRGIRILRQDPWEMLATFIISQRKSIPAIRGAVERLAYKFGNNLGCVDDGKDIFSFPSAYELKGASIADFSECSLGYRAPYLEAAVSKTLSGEFDPSVLGGLDDDALFEKLKEIHGVGKKVANCVCLFGYGRTGRAPVDVWIQRAIDEHFGGQDIFPLFGDAAGIVQQYVFYAMKHNDSSNP